MEGFWPEFQARGRFMKYSMSASNRQFMALTWDLRVSVALLAKLAKTLFVNLRNVMRKKTYVVIQIRAYVGSQDISCMFT